jgi:hypothetical protein
METTILSSKVILFITAITIFFACETERDYYQMDNGRVIKIIEFDQINLANNGVADYYSESVIKIKADQNSTERKVIFKRSKGNFSNGEDSIVVEINAYGEGTLLFLHPDTPGTIQVSAILAGLKIDTLLTFTESFADDFKLTADTYEGDSASQFTFTSALVKEKGVITQGQKVRFFFLKNDTTLNYPILEPFSTTSNNEATATLTNPFNYKGRFEVISRVPVSETDSIDRHAIIEIK